MWSINTAGAKVDGRSNISFFLNILNGHENKLRQVNDLSLLNGQSRLDARKYYFPKRILNDWNKLSADCVHSSSIKMLANRRLSCRT